MENNFPKPLPFWIKSCYNTLINRKELTMKEMKHKVGERVKVSGVIVEVDRLEQCYIVNVGGCNRVRCYDENLSK